VAILQKEGRMDSAFKDAIREHLQLKERNRWIEPTMPLSRYRFERLSERGEVDQNANPGRGDILDPDGPAGWPTAEGLGLERPDSLWASLPDDEPVSSASEARRPAA
jgi:hypothetical protein